MVATILVIEDEPLTRKNLVGFLGAEGFKTLEASNGRDGIELAQTHMPDLIICDILMPELDGYDVLITLQQQQQTAAIPFIFLTVSATEDGFRQGLALGADDYLSKPVTSEQLRTSIAAQLKRSKPSLGTTPEVSATTSLEADLLQQFSLERPSSVSTSSLPAEISVVSAKAQLLEMLCPTIRQRLINLRETVERVQSTTLQQNSSQELRDEFVRLLSLVNEACALQKTLTTENSEDLLEMFAIMVEDDGKLT
ncbi:MAG: response regulator [Leptolyngbya sp. SIO3F4]|nr:response regulator [Leptolyngbya sp. SIO3F4]